MKLSLYITLVVCYSTLSIAQLKWKMPHRSKLTKIPLKNPTGIYGMDVCRTFKTIEVVLNNYTDALQRLDAAYDNGLWRDRGESLADWIRQLKNWDRLILERTADIWETKTWSKEEQMEGASCYADYFTESGRTLVMLEEFRTKYPWDGDFRCTMFEVLNNTAQDYEGMADRLYRWNGMSKDGLFTAEFPDEIPFYWCLEDCSGKTKPHPRLNASISDWMRNKDKPLAPPFKNGTFVQTLKAWDCGEKPKKPHKGKMRWTWNGLDDDAEDGNRTKNNSSKMWLS